MRRSPCRSLMFAASLCLAAYPAAASFALPSDAVIAVKEFAFSITPPARPDGSTESDLPTAFHAQLAVALQKAGFSLYQGESAAPLNVPPDAPQNVSPGVPPGVPDQNSPALIVTPLAENSAQDAPAQEEAQQGEQGTDESLPPLEVLEAPENPEASGEAEADAPAQGEAQEEEAVPETPPAEPKTPVQNGAATHILEGTVTFRETVGAPNRIGGTVRVRIVSRAHGAYTIRDAASGKTLVTDAFTGSAASLARESEEYGVILEGLRSRAMTTAAETIAARLSGTNGPEDGAGSDRNYYQDSPGKRLKPKK